MTTNIEARAEIFAAINRERGYQEREYPANPHTVAEWCVIMHNELSEAMQAWSEGSREDGDVFALEEILQVVAVGVACMEQHYPEHGVRER